MPKAKKKHIKPVAKQNEKTEGRKLNRDEVAVRVGVGPTKLSTMIARLPGFPMEGRAKKNEAWAIPIELVDEWRAKHNLLTQGDGAISDMQLNAKLRNESLLMELRQKKSELIWKDDCQREVNSVFIALSKELDNMVENVSRQMRFERPVIDLWKKKMNDARDRARSQLKSKNLLPPGA
jgi:hypothetical protein